MYKFEMQFATNDRAPFRIFLDVCTSFFDSFTIDECQGYWKGKSEKSYRVTIFSDDMQGTYTLLKKLADIIKAVYHQEAVLVSWTKKNVALF